jgi:hypothetical protein
MKRVLSRILLAIAASLCISVGILSQQPAAPASGPASTSSAPKPEVVKPKEPYDDRDAQLAAEVEKNLRLQYAGTERDLQDKIAALPQVQQLEAETAAAEQKLNAQFAEQQKALATWTDKVRKDNGWDASYQWNAATREWSHAAPTPAPADQGKKP